MPKKNKRDSVKGEYDFKNIPSRKPKKRAKVSIRKKLEEWTEEWEPIS